MQFCPDCPNKHRCTVSNDCMGFDPSDLKRTPDMKCDPCGAAVRTCNGSPMDCPNFRPQPPAPCALTPAETDRVAAIKAEWKTARGATTTCPDCGVPWSHYHKADCMGVLRNRPWAADVVETAQAAMKAERKAAQAKINAATQGSVTTDSAARKATPITTGVLDYFPLALAAVARLSKIGNDKHNPGMPMHWAREKSTDHADCIARHMIDRGTIDPDSGELHEVGVAWRALAQLQLAEEKRLAR